MEFELTGDLIDLRDLAAEIFTDLATVDRIVEVERNAAGFDRDLWRTLAEAGLFAVALPETAGGSGLGVQALVVLAQQQGRRVAPVPLVPVVAGAALPLSQFGTPGQQSRWLGPLLDGTHLVTSAWDAGPGRETALTGRADGDRLVVSGVLPSVAAADESVAIVCPLVLEDGSMRVVVVPTDAPGVTVTRQVTSNRESHALVELDQVAVPADQVLGEDGGAVRDWSVRRIRVAMAGLALGTCEEALRMTAKYTSARFQFGRPLSTNQAVAVRAADSYLDTEAIRLTTWRAAWLLDSGREQEAESGVLVASWWAAEGGLRVVRSTQHLHGGIGADVDYPIHRYFLWGRRAAFTLGTAASLAAELGDTLETAPRIGAPA